MPKFKANGATRQMRARALETEKPVHTLLQAGLRRPKRAVDWAAISSATTVVVTPDGRPIRTVVTGRRHLVTGSYASRKAGRAQVHESMNERALFLHSEVDPQIANYLSQPCRFEFVLDGAKRSYIPDCARVLGDGSVEIVEVKLGDDGLRDADYVRKLEHVRQACNAVGWSFRIVFGAPLRERTTRNKNVQLIQHHRFASYSARDVYIVQNLLSATSTLPLERLAEALGGAIAGRAQICAMMVGRHLAIDLQAPLSRDSAVSTLNASNSEGGQ